MIFDRLNEKYYRQIANKEAQDNTRKRIHWICSQTEGKSVLDIGCSQGIVCILLGREGFYCTGVDIMQQSVDYAHLELEKEEEAVKQRVRFECMDAFALEFDDNTFDTVFLTEVIEHLTQPANAIAEAKRVLKPNGKFVLTVPYGYNKSIDHKNYFFLSDTFQLLIQYFEPQELYTSDRYIYFTSHKSDNRIPKDQELVLLRKYSILDNRFLLEQDMRLFHQEDLYHGKIAEAQQYQTKLENDIKVKEILINKYEQERSEFFDLLKQNTNNDDQRDKKDTDVLREISLADAKVSDDTKPFITFGIFTYNRAHLIKEAIDSILAQGAENFEILVVDDGSTDNTEEVVKSIDNDRIRYIKKEHSGAPETRNRIIDEAKGDYICWIGDDDKLELNVIQEYYKILEDNDPDVIYGNIQQYDDETGENLHLYEAPDYTQSNRDFLKKIISGVGLTDGGSLIKKSIYDKYGKYDLEFQRTQDLEFWSRIATSAKLIKNNRIVYKCRKHSRHLSSGDVNDKSYESLINKKILNKHSLKEIYWDYDWSNPDQARLAGLKEIARGFMLTSDYYNANLIFEKAGFNHSDNELLGWWFNCLLRMGNKLKINSFLNAIEKVNNALFVGMKANYQKFINDIDVLETASNQPENANPHKIKEVVNNYSFSQRILLFLARNFEILRNKEEIHKYYLLALQCDASNEYVYNKALASAQSDSSKIEVEKKRERLLRDLPLFEDISDDCSSSETIISEALMEDIKDKESDITSIVICAYNNFEYTKACIEAIYEKTDRDLFEIIAIDNGSTDGTKDYFKIISEKESNFKPIINDENLGFAKGCNQGIINSTGKYVLLLNNDTLPQDAWLENMTSEMVKDESIGIVGACLLYPDSNLIQHVWVTIGNQNNYIAPYHEYSFYNIAEVPEANISREVSAVTGACMLIRRSMLVQTGLLDENYLNSFEDIDFCFRVKAAGYKIRYAADSKLIHHESATKSRHDNDVKNWQLLNQKWLGKVEFDETEQETLRKNAEIDKRREKALEVPYEEVHKEHEPEIDSDIDFSIIIPVHNNLKYTKQCLEGIAKTRGLFEIEIIVIDNGSTDSTEKYILSLGRNVYLIKNDKKETYAHANNQGAAIAKGKFLIFLNNDTLPFPGWLESIANEFEENCNTGLQGAKLLYENGTIQHAGMIFGTRPGKPEEPYHAYLTADPSMPFVNRRRKVQFVTGAVLAIRSNIYDKINGFDEGYYFGWEDTDLCMKVNNEGYDVIYNPGAVLYHYESTTKKIVAKDGLDVLNPDTPRESANRERFFRKWKNSVIKDDETFYLEDGFKLDNHTLIQMNKIVEQQEIKFYDKEKKEYKTSFSPENWKRDYDRISTVLFKCEPAVGDSLTMTAVIRNLKEKYNHLVIYVSGNEITNEIFKHNDDIEDFALTGSVDEFNLEAMTDLVIDYNHLLGKFIDYYNNLPYMDIIANIAGVKLLEKGIVYTITQQEIDWALEFMGSFKKSGKVIGVQFHTNKDDKRIYPYGSELIKYLNESDSELNIVNLGTEPLKIDEDYILDTAEQGIDFRHQIALCSQCDAFLTIDSAFFHVGHNLFNKPTLVITGVTNPKLIGNSEAGFRFIRNESLDCLNCYWQKKCNIECMNELMPEEVGKKMLDILTLDPIG